jgi:hypothetical protein
MISAINRQKHNTIKGSTIKSGKIKHYELLWYNEHGIDIKSGLDRIRLSVSDSPRKYVDHTNSIIDDLIAERE